MSETSPPAWEFCLCADDFALSPSVNRGIVAALAASRLNATSAMTTRPSWPRAARDLAAAGFDADVGLHLNLTLATPLTRMAQFAPSTFPDIGHILRGAVKGQLPLAEIAQEIEAQIDAFVAAFGGPPDFVDGHQHVQILPGIRQCLFGVLERKGLTGRLWLRNSGDRLARIFARRIEMKKALGLAWLARGFAAEAAAQGFAVNDGFAGYSAFRVEADYGADFARYLMAPGARHLIMCHPGLVDDELAAVDAVTASRETELAFLLSPRFLEVLEEAGACGARLSRLVQIPSKQ
ncbi:MAG: ChbG/HpnK family deacetylase [Beijerinckiaceae bacterium]